MLRIAEYAFKTDTGRQRRANEDSYFAQEPIFAVADGMGGAQAGEVASRMAAGAFDSGLPGEGPAERRLEKVFHEANGEIHELSERDADRAGMGTTLTAAYVEGDKVSVGHVGDSRAYLLRDGRLRRLTSDHSLVEELRKQGRITEEEASDHPQRSVITRALGPDDEVEVDTLTQQARAGDVFLLCSDGLTTMLTEDEIRDGLIESKTLRTAVSKLVEAANKAGGRDNITAVAFRFEGEDEEQSEDVTLIARTAEQAGATAEKVRSATDRLKGDVPMPAPRRRRWAWRVGVTVAVVAILGLLGFLLARQVYFLGTDDSGRVALYRGLPYELPLGVDLYSEQYAVGVPITDLSAPRREVVTDNRLRSKADAEDLIRDIESTEGAEPPKDDGKRSPAGRSEKSKQQDKGK